MGHIAHFPLARLSDVPFVLLRNAELTFDSNGIPLIDENIVKRARDASAAEGYIPSFPNASTFSVAIRDDMFRHYFHFMETFLVLYAVHRELFPRARLSKIFFGRFDWNNSSHANVQRQVLSSLYPDVEIVTGLPAEPITIENLVYIDRFLSRTPFNKMIEPALFLVLKWATELRHAVYKAIAVTELSDIRAPGTAWRSPRILYVPRHPPRALSSEAEVTLLEMLSRFGVVESVAFSDLSWENQVRSAANHDIMVGVHGNGLTNLLWLPKHAMAIELFPDDVHCYDYQLMAEVMQLEYFGIDGFRIFRSFSRHGEIYGNPTKPVLRLMENEIAFALNTFALRRR
jgi:hypothetical protein